MPEITSILIIFILLAVAYPRLIKNKHQFYIAVALTMLAILLSPFEITILRFAAAILQALAFLALVLSAGGMAFVELADNMVNAYDAVRHGEEKPVIVPRTGEVPKQKEPAPPPPIITPPPAPEPPIPLEPPKDYTA